MSRQLRKLRKHLLAISREAGGDVRADVFTLAQIANLLTRAMWGDADAAHTVEPLATMATAFLARGEPGPCYACGEQVG